MYGGQTQEEYEALQVHAECIGIEEAKAGSQYHMYRPAGKLFAWIKKVFIAYGHKNKYVVRSKQRDPFNWGNKENVLYDKPLFVCSTKDELIQYLLDCHNHMTKNIEYITMPGQKVIYACASEKVIRESQQYEDDAL